MALTPETLLRHELNGLRVAVVDAPNPDLVGICGRVVGETMRMLHVESADARVRQVPKRDSTLEFELPLREGAATVTSTDEAAGAAKAPGTASELRSETAGGTTAGQSGRCQGAAYVTVDGTRLLSRPALRTEKTGDSLWR